MSKVAKNKKSHNTTKSMGSGDIMENNKSQTNIPPVDVSLVEGSCQRKQQMMPEEDNGFTNSAQLHGNRRQLSIDWLQPA